jgi:hypothetical protein
MGRRAFARDWVGPPDPQEQLARGDRFELLRAQGFGRQYVHALDGVEMTVEDPADRAVGPGDGPQDAPLLPERGPSFACSWRIGHRQGEEARLREDPERAVGEGGVGIAPGGAFGDLGEHRIEAGGAG